MNYFKLFKVLYGLNQSPRERSLKRFGLKEMIRNTCLYLIIRYKGNQLYIVAIYVDDQMISGSTLTVVNDVKSLF